MSLSPYWFRHLRNLTRRDPVSRILSEDPFAIFARDPFFRDSLQRAEREQALDDHYGAGAESEVKVDGNKVEVELDVRGLSPKQLRVRTVGDEVVVEGKQEGQGEGWRRHWVRRFLLPEGFPPERVECRLQEDRGRLLLAAYRGQPLPEREVPVKTDKDAPSQDKAVDKD